jgi:hypothetical protein
MCGTSGGQCALTVICVRALGTFFATDISTNIYTHLSSGAGETGIETLVPRYSFSAHPKNKIKINLNYFLINSSRVKTVMLKHKPLKLLTTRPL